MADFTKEMLLIMKADFGDVHQGVDKLKKTFGETSGVFVNHKKHIQKTWRGYRALNRYEWQAADGSKQVGTGMKEVTKNTIPLRMEMVSLMFIGRELANVFKHNTDAALKMGGGVDLLNDALTYAQFKALQPFNKALMGIGSAILGSDGASLALTGWLQIIAGGIGNIASFASQAGITVISLHNMSEYTKADWDAIRSLITTIGKGVGKALLFGAGLALVIWGLNKMKNTVDEFDTEKYEKIAELSLPEPVKKIIAAEVGSAEAVFNWGTLAATGGGALAGWVATGFNPAGAFVGGLLPLMAANIYGAKQGLEKLNNAEESFEEYATGEPQPQQSFQIYNTTTPPNPSLYDVYEQNRNESSVAAIQDAINNTDMSILIPDIQVSINLGDTGEGG